MANNVTRHSRYTDLNVLKLAIKCAVMLLSLKESTIHISFSMQSKTIGLETY
jgi:hypothetical protein